MTAPSWPTEVSPADGLIEEDIYVGLGEAHRTSSRSTLVDVEEMVTPRMVAEQLGVTPTMVRAWLRRRGEPQTNGRWRLDPQTAQLLIDAYLDRVRETERTTCGVQGCPRPCTVRAKLCRVHARRLRRNGDLEERDGAEHQRAKTHCPKGHEYTEANTYVFSDGRRRCRRCRIDAAMASESRRRSIDATPEDRTAR